MMAAILNLGLRGAANHSAESAFKGRSAKIAPRGTRFTSTSRQLVQLCLTNFLQQITCRIGFGTHGCITINTHIIHLIYFECNLHCIDTCNGVQREHNKKLNNGLPILHKVPPKRDYGRYFCIMAEKGGTSHGGLTEKLSLFFHAKKQEVNAYGR